MITMLVFLFIHIMNNISIAFVCNYIFVISWAFLTYFYLPTLAFKENVYLFYNLKTTTYLYYQQVFLFNATNKKNCDSSYDKI